MELIIVVVIIGVMYALGLSQMKAPKTEDIESFTLFTLPQYLRDNYRLSDAKIVCLEPCGKCSVLVDGAFLEKELELFESANVKSYELSLDGYATEKEYLPYDKQDTYKQACFVLHKGVNDSIEPVVLEVEGRFIYYKAGYEKAKSYKSLAILQDSYKKELDLIRNAY